MFFVAQRVFSFSCKYNSFFQSSGVSKKHWMETKIRLNVENNYLRIGHALEMQEF